MVDENGLLVISGTISDVDAAEVTENIFFSAGDRAGMAATGAIAAALGLSGPAAGMAMMSGEDMDEPVMRLKFKLDDRNIDAILWNWPFKEGDKVTVVGRLDDSGVFFALSVVNEESRIISSYPHVSAGGRAHWMSVLKYTSLASFAASFLCVGGFGVFSINHGIDDLVLIRALTLSFLGLFFLLLFVGYRVGRNFARFTVMAEAIFSALGWPDPGKVNLRKISKKNRVDGDPPALGDTYFRY